jgi:hypothetical protein
MQATLNSPPNTQAFDPVNRGISLIGSAVSTRQASAFVTPVTTPQMSDIGHLSTLITTIFGAAGNPANTTPVRLASQVTSPQVAHSSLSLNDDDLVYSPSHIPRFLKHASSKLGVRNALDFESPLRRKGYGPDILPDIADSELVALGISEGDVICLKNGSRRWWNGPDAKRKLGEVDDDNFFSRLSTGHMAGDAEADTSNGYQNKRVCHYEYRFPEGDGATRYNAAPMQRGGPEDHDRFTSYYDEKQWKMLPIPNGFTAPTYDAFDNED